ncbi:PhzF family phenazine biosynthesis protein [Roseococcus sp.]|uniref:PhzF family phenazine biosynthesis protein n=1 Tax=Roseococcus sp. TaxID=2109646 RepID=UPI003BA844C8
MSRTFRYVTLDVFTDRRFGGNQLAVFPDARGITDAEMQSLAAEMNYSETTFVLPPADPANSARVRIFHRTAEMPFAGHPNVGTAFVLADRAKDDVLRFEEIAGLVEIKLARDAAGAVTSATVAAPQALTVGVEMPVELAAACAGIPAEGVVTTRHAPTIAHDGGNPRLLFEVTPEAMAAASPDLAAFRRAVAATPSLGGKLSVYFYRPEGTGLRARMFSPLAGTWEDPATGSAATPLAGFLLSLSGAETGSWDIQQGVEMGRPSLLRAAAKRTPGGIRATVGGGCVPMFEGSVTL